MKKTIIFSCLFMMFLSLTLSSSGNGTGGTGETGGNSVSSSYGTLTLSGNGSSITGTQFYPTQFTSSSFNSPLWVANYQWHTANYSDGVIVQCYISGCGVQFYHAIGTVNWVAGTSQGASGFTSPAGLTVGTSSITFNNVSLSGVRNTTTSLTLNGTLSFNGTLSLLSPPSGITVQVAPNSVRLQFSPVAGATGYRVYYGLSSGSYTGVIDIGNSTDKNISALAGTYFGALTAYNSTSESGYSAEGRVVIPGT